MINIIIVDSNEQDCMECMDAFQEFGFVFNVKCVNSFERLKEFFASSDGPQGNPPVDLILLDEYGRGQDKCFSFLKKSGVMKNAKVVLLSETEDIETIKKSIKAGAEYVIKKPFSIYSFIDYIRKTNYFALTVVKTGDGK